MKRQGYEHGRGLPNRTHQQWVRQASAAILTLLQEELAVAHPELEARLSTEGVMVGAGRVHFDAHIITEAVRQLRDLHAIDEIRHVTKAGATLPLLVPADQRDRATYIQRAVRRKGMLYRRFTQLSDTAGRAGEEVLRHSMSIAGPHLIPMQPGFGEVRTLMGVKLYGSLDSGAWLHAIDKNGIPLRPFALPVEMKNRRQTLYPIHKEVHQLLSKAATLQAAQPDYPIMPVLVCRNAHSRLFWMAKDLGFRVHATRRQFISLPKEMTPRLFEEVRDELRLLDLTPVSPTSMPTIQQFFRDTITTSAGPASRRWAAAAPYVAPYADALRTEAIPPAERQELMRELRQKLDTGMAAAGFTDPLLSWSLPDREEDEEEDDQYL